jgi:hypothetical protein
MSAAWDQVQESVGALLLPAIDNIAPAVQHAAVWFEDVGVPAVDDFAKHLIDRLTPAFSAVASWITGTVIPALSNLADWIRNQAIPAIADFGKSFGTNVIVPAVQTAVDWITKHLIPGIQGLVKYLVDHRKAFAEFFQPFVDIAAKVIPATLLVAEAFGAIGAAITFKLWPVIRPFFDWLGDHKDVLQVIAASIILGVVVPAFYAWATAATEAAVASAAAWAAAAGPSLIVVAGLTAIGLALLVVKDNWQWIVDHWGLLASVFIGPVAIFLQWFEEHWHLFWDPIQAAYNWINSVWTSVWNPLKAPFEIAWHYIATLDGSPIETLFKIVNWIIHGPWQLLLGPLIAPFAIAIEWIVNAFGGLAKFFERIRDIAGQIFSQIAYQITAPFVFAYNVIKTILGGIASLIDHIKNLAGDVAGFVTDPIGSIGGVLGIGKHAKGGIFTSPTLGIIGEAGPEAVIPLTGNNTGIGNTYYFTIQTSGLGADDIAIQQAIVKALDLHTNRSGPLKPSIVGG